MSTTFLWLEITGRCQLACTHCYADSGPAGTHGTMTVPDWYSVIDQAADAGVEMVQFIGGEPTLHPGLPDMIGHALAAGIEVEVYSNLVYISRQMWTLFEQPGMRLATSWYSDDPGQHRAITGRNTMHRTEANIIGALARGIPLRAGIIDLGDGQRVAQAEQHLAELGVIDVGIDRMRLLGRPAHTPCDASELCGRCGDGIAAILPDGTLTPCPLARWLSAGTVRGGRLTELVGRAASIAQELIPAALSRCRPDCSPPCEPSCNPGCNPGCAPGGGDGCDPRGTCNPNQPCRPKNPCQPDVAPCRPVRR